MEFIDLKTQYRRLEPAIRARINAVLEHGHFIMGPEIKELEAALATTTGARHAITCASGTDALLLPLLAWGIGPGDAVFTSPFTFFATAEVIALVGATPVFVDVDPITFNISPEGLERAIRAVRQHDASIHPLPLPALRDGLVPRAVIPVDLFGVAAEYDELLPIARQHGLLVMEDAAQAFGGSYRGKPLCGLGCDAATTSFFPAKPLGCYGDGGAVFTDDDGLAEVLRSLRVHGKGSDKYENVRVGINGRMDTLQAAIMLPKVTILPDEMDARQRVAAAYTARLSGVPGITPPSVPAHCRSAWAQYSILCDRRDALAAHLKANGVPTAIYYPKPLHVQRVFSGLGYAIGDMPVAESLSEGILSLPMHPYLSEAEQDVICGHIAAHQR